MVNEAGVVGITAHWPRVDVVQGSLLELIPADVADLCRGVLVR